MYTLSVDGGTEVQTLSLVEALVEAGHRPVVACYFEYAEGMVERYRRAGAEVRLMSEDGSRPSGIRAVAKHLYQGFKRIIMETKPDIAHVQYMTPAALAIVVLRLLGVKKIIATSHTDADIYGKNGLRVIRFLTNHVLSGFQCITLRAERSYFGEAYLFDGKPGKHFTIYNCLPSHITIDQRTTDCITDQSTRGTIGGNGEDQRTRETRGKSKGAMSNPNDACGSGQNKRNGGPLIVGVVSRLEEIKGMDLVIPAFAKVAKEYPEVKLLVIGDGSLRRPMERQTDEAGLTERVEFIGRQPQDRLQEFYDRIDILLMPSRSEGFGLTAIEGMARGCVPVVANTGGLPEVVTEECGLLHEPGNADDLAEKINRLVEVPEKVHRLSAGAIERAKVFSKEQYNEVIHKLYELMQ